MNPAVTMVGPWMVRTPPGGFETVAGDRVRHIAGKGLVCESCGEAEKPTTVLALLAYLTRHKHSRTP